MFCSILLTVCYHKKLKTKTLKHYFFSKCNLYAAAATPAISNKSENRNTHNSPESSTNQPTRKITNAPANAAATTTDMKPPGNGDADNALSAFFLKVSLGAKLPNRLAATKKKIVPRATAHELSDVLPLPPSDFICESIDAMPNQNFELWNSL